MESTKYIDDDGYRSCDNCGNNYCFMRDDAQELKELFIRVTGGHVPCDWKPISCPHCGGILSVIREHNGRRYRHCFACHFETEVKDEGF